MPFHGSVPFAGKPVFHCYPPATSCFSFITRFKCCLLCGALSHLSGVSLSAQWGLYFVPGPGVTLLLHWGWMQQAQGLEGCLKSHCLLYCSYLIFCTLWCFGILKTLLFGGRLPLLSPASRDSRRPQLGVCLWHQTNQSRAYYCLGPSAPRDNIPQP